MAYLLCVIRYVVARQFLDILFLYNVHFSWTSLYWYIHTYICMLQLNHHLLISLYSNTSCLFLAFLPFVVAFLHFIWFDSFYTFILYTPKPYIGLFLFLSTYIYIYLHM